ncbi:response regulator transcription factor [Stenotrophomonas terrae]|uniref:response regulator n=1 Tax=Stenotrophomonas terrae TaxID=405446 RepID=UPI00320B1121
MKSIRVLLAEDSMAVARPLQLLLASEFEVVGWVQDGHSLLSMARELKPVVVVTDITMPGLDGLAAAERLLTEGVIAHVVFITVHDAPALVQRAMGHRHCGYVLKADAGEELLLGVREVLAGRSFMSASIVKRMNAEHGNGLG